MDAHKAEELAKEAAQKVVRAARDSGFQAILTRIGIPMDAHRASRGVALAFAIWTAWRVWAPPGALVAEEGGPSGLKRNKDAQQLKKDLKQKGLEGLLSTAMWKLMFFAAIGCQTAFQVYVFQHYSGGLKGFLNAKWSAMDIVSLVSMASAARLRRRAYKALGKYFTYKLNVAKDQPLVTEGPYRSLMHPGYTALLMHILPFLHFIGLKHDLPVLALYTVIGIFPFSSRIINEEKYLEEHFGKVAFDKYKSERWHVIPYVI